MQRNNIWLLSLKMTPTKECFRFIETLQQGVGNGSAAGRPACLVENYIILVSRPAPPVSTAQLPSLSFNHLIQRCFRWSLWHLCHYGPTGTNERASWQVAFILKCEVLP